MLIKKFVQTNLGSGNWSSLSGDELFSPNKFIFQVKAAASNCLLGFSLSLLLLYVC